MWTFFQTQGRLSGEFTIQTADASTREVEFTAVTSVLPGLHIAVLRDVTARNQARAAAEQRLQALNRRLRDMSSRARARRDADRARLSRELHDQLGQSLAALKMDLHWLGGRLPDGVAPGEDLRSKVEGMTAIVDDTILRVRRLTSELRPAVLDRLGLVAAIEWHLGEFSRRTGVSVRFNPGVDEVPLDEGRKTAIFWIFQDAVSNVALHAHATAVTARLYTHGKSVMLIVSDNGRGIPQEALDSDASLGLLSMRERTQLLGGTILFKRARPSGTIVTVAIPLAERRRSPRNPMP